jgi:hypothetical protein
MLPEVTEGPSSRLPLAKKTANGSAMKSQGTKTALIVLQDRKRLPQRFFAKLSGMVTGHSA